MSVKNNTTSFDWDADKNKFSPSNKNHKILSNEPYAEELYALIEQHDHYNDVTDTSVMVPEIGQRLTGTLVGQSGNEVFLDYGGKYTVTMKLDSNEINHILNDDGSPKSVGDDVDFLVMSISPKGDIKGSIYGLEVVKREDYLAEIAGKDEFIEAEVKEVNKFGYIMDYDGVDLFMLHFNSDVNMIPKDSQQDMLGKKLKVAVESYSDVNENFQVSRKRYMETLIPQKMEKLVVGNVYEGVVTGTTSFGIFIQFEDVLTGMIHKDNVHEDYRDRLEEIEPGTPITFYYKETLKNNKIILTQYWKESIWDTIQKDDIYDGTVSSVRSFGALVRLDWDTIGVVHNNTQKKMGVKLEKGDKIEVCVDSFIRNEKKIFLSLVD